MGNIGLFTGHTATNLVLVVSRCITASWKHTAAIYANFAWLQAPFMKPRPHPHMVFDLPDFLCGVASSGVAAKRVGGGERKGESNSEALSSSLLNNAKYKGSSSVPFSSVLRELELRDLIVVFVFEMVDETEAEDIVEVVVEAHAVVWCVCVLEPTTSLSVMRFFLLYPLLSDNSSWLRSKESHLPFG